MEQILNSYYANNARRLHKMVNRILLRFGGLSDKDYDDFYSLANEVFTDAMRRYDCEQPFDKFLYCCLFNKIKSEMTRRNCIKRMADRNSISIDTPVSNDDEYTVGDMIASKFDLEKEIFGENVSNSTKIERYLSRLSQCQRKIVYLLIESYKAVEIQDILQITQRQYKDAMCIIRSYEKVKILL